MDGGVAMSIIISIGAALLVAGLVFVSLFVRLYRPTRRLPQPASNHFVAAATKTRGCTHTSVPWPVLSGGDLVAWLCPECKEQRDTFACPPIRYRVLCEHPDMEEIRTWGSGIVERWCKDCGQRQMLSENFVATFTEEEIAFKPLVEKEQ
jgi:hypothetical protein